MTQGVLKAGSGDWLLQTAAASALGRMVIRLGKHFGFRTINVVRRPEQAEELRREGAEYVVASNAESVVDKVRAWTEGAGVKFALDAVGGAAGRAAVDSLGPDGRMLVYGTLSNEPIPLDPRVLMVGRNQSPGSGCRSGSSTRASSGCSSCSARCKG